MMIGAIESALTGLFVNSKKKEISAHNVANSSTDGYKKKRITIDTNQAGATKVNITEVITKDPPPIQQQDGLPETVIASEGSNVDIAEEMVNMLIADNGFRANLKTLQNAEDILGTILDIVS